LYLPNAEMTLDLEVKGLASLASVTEAIASGIMSLSAKASVPKAVERSLSGPSVLKEESILANSMQVTKMNRQDRRAGQSVVRGTRAAIYTHLATVYTTLGVRAACTRLFVRPVGSTARTCKALEKTLKPSSATTAPTNGNFVLLLVLSIQFFDGRREFHWLCKNDRELPY
jgi:hypothetical protein